MKTSIAPAGRIGQSPIASTQAFQLLLNTLGRLADPEEFGDIIVKVGGLPVRSCRRPDSMIEPVDVAVKLQPTSSAATAYRLPLMTARTSGSLSGLLVRYASDDVPEQTLTITDSSTGTATSYRFGGRRRAATSRRNERPAAASRPGYAMHQRSPCMLRGNAAPTAARGGSLSDAAPTSSVASTRHRSAPRCGSH